MTEKVPSQESRADNWVLMSVPGIMEIQIKEILRTIAVCGHIIRRNSSSSSSSSSSYPSSSEELMYKEGKVHLQKRKEDN